MPKKSILSAFFEGGAAALYAAAKKGDIEQQDEENNLTMQSKREALKQQQYGNTAIGPNALDVPEDTPHSYANTMIGMRAKDITAKTKAQMADANDVKTEAYAKGKDNQDRHWKAMEGSAKEGLAIRRFNAATARISALSGKDKGLDEQTHKEVLNLTTTGQKYMNLAYESLRAQDTTAYKAFQIKAVQSVEQAAKIAENSRIGKSGGGPPDKAKPKPPAQYSMIPRPELRAQFRKDHPEFDYSGMDN